MADKLIFLGTAGDSVVASKQYLKSGGIVLQTEDVQLHIDPGPGATVGAAQNGVNVRNTTCVLVSHNHLLHCNDVNAVIDAMTFGGLDKGGVLVCNSTTVNGADKFTPILTQFHKSCLERFIVLKEGQKVAIEDIEIHGTTALHKDPATIGFKIFCKEFVLGYTSDTKYSKSTATALHGSDILILNVTYPFTERSNHHLNSEDAVKIIEKVQPNLAIITHFGTSMIKADPLQEAREIQKQTGVQTIAAKDGFSLTPSEYGANSRQQRLNKFT